MNDYVRLKEFGFNFMGPLLFTYLSKVEFLRQTANYRVYHLAREGYFLKDCYEKLSADKESTYLYVSRTFLFRIMITDSYSWDYSLKHNYNGTLENFFISRFGFTPGEVRQFVEERELNKSVFLPDDFTYIEDILSQKIDQLTKIVERSRITYALYLESLGLYDINKIPLFLDLGYSGTIQKLLTRFLERDTKGLYFITTKSEDFDIAGNVASIEHAFKTNVKMGDGYLMLDRSMFLESLLTAPQGQFIDILNLNGRFKFFFGKSSYTQENPDKLHTLFEGAAEAINEYRESNITFSQEEIESIFGAYVLKRNLLPAVSWPLFEFDDAISGFGTVNSLKFFGL